MNVISQATYSSSYGEQVPGHVKLIGLVVGFESSYNGIELSPFYDTIIFSDIADIMKEFESSSIPLFDKLAKYDSESDENVEDLLQEYQKYLEKENKQRKEYVGRTKLKNRVPLLRHERFNKPSYGNGDKYNDYLYKNGYYSSDPYKSKNPLNLFTPINPKVNYFNTAVPTTKLPHDSMELNIFKKILLSEDNPSIPQFPFKAPCCKNGKMSCKQCAQANLEPRVSLYSDEKKSNGMTENKYITDPDDALNIRIKIDVQLPKIHERLDKHHTFDLNDGSNTKDFPLAIKMPTSYYNLPIPMNLFGYKRVSKLNTSPNHKMTIHKKKKPKTNTGGKKHRKKLITFHNINLEPQQIFQVHFGKSNTTNGITNEINSTVAANLGSITKEIIETNNSVTTSAPLVTVKTTDTQTEENIFLLVNISNNMVNNTEEANKTSNSIETEYTNAIFNATTENSLHSIKKREAGTANKTVTIAADNKTVTVDKKDIELNQTIPQIKIIANITKAIKHNAIDNAKKVDKSLPSEDELLYWPNNNISQSKTLVTKNITSIILETETKKAKLNMTKETIRDNHTKALEKAIFGDVDWNDVDAVAPAFMSFIGKYIEGTLTICSDIICHSMKCAQKEEEEFYLNPWSTIDIERQQIIDFDSNGNVIHKDTKKIINFSKELLSGNKDLQNFFSNGDQSRDTKEMKTKIIKLVRVLDALNDRQRRQTPKKLKLLTNCRLDGSLTEGRGIGSTLWGWLTYPLSWWGSEPELAPINEQLIASTSKYEPLESIEIAKHTVTVWCNDQTCTTQKCDRFGCRNMTCNIYDTDMMGECREYNTISTSDEPKHTEPLTKTSLQDKATETTKALESTSTTVATVTSAHKPAPIQEDHPLELEAVLSSTVFGNDEKVGVDIGDLIKLEQKVSVY
ncbi:Uncharacterized protein OBRU01_05961 [Operophtera brumata]|uniref:Uncharacterized protein n=1 Tax=Operophtera brumata TaxID=104452 RepID=A0A0L7LLM3_OPEBR|nr:Uncharacterized protein OBRU01_05961 [Operophtera brumata]